MKPNSERPSNCPSLTESSKVGISTIVNVAPQDANRANQWEDSTYSRRLAHLPRGRSPEEDADDLGSKQVHQFSPARHLAHFLPTHQQGPDPRPTNPPQSVVMPTTHDATKNATRKDAANDVKQPSKTYHAKRLSHFPLRQHTSLSTLQPQTEDGAGRRPGAFPQGDGDRGDLDTIVLGDSSREVSLLPVAAQLVEEGGASERKIPVAEVTDGKRNRRLTYFLVVLSIVSIALAVTVPLVVTRGSGVVGPEDEVSSAPTVSFMPSSGRPSSSPSSSPVTIFGESLDTDTTTSITIRNSDLSGTIPTEIGLLSKLTLLLLEGNELSGSIPSELGTLTELKILSLAANELVGTIPSELTFLSNLTILELARNNLSGSIHTEIGLLPQLEVLYLAGNFMLEGSIPSEIQFLTRLMSLDLNDNFLSGSIPSVLGLLTLMTELDLYDNSLVGTIPLELQLLSTELTELELGDNPLLGEIPTELGLLTQLTYLDLAKAGLSGSIPTEFFGLSDLQHLYLEYNGLTGTIPTQVGNFSRLETWWIAFNPLNGTIPTQLGLCTELDDIFMANNSLGGNFPSEIGLLTKLTELDVATNRLSGSLPMELQQLSDLSLCWLFENLLTGSFPSSLCTTTKATSFRIDCNTMNCSCCECT